MKCGINEILKYDINYTSIVVSDNNVVLNNNEKIEFDSQSKSFISDLLGLISYPIDVKLYKSYYLCSLLFRSRYKVVEYYVLKNKIIKFQYDELFNRDVTILEIEITENKLNKYEIVDKPYIYYQEIDMYLWMNYNNKTILSTGPPPYYLYPDMLKAERMELSQIRNVALSTIQIYISAMIGDGQTPTFPPQPTNKSYSVIVSLSIVLIIILMI